ncbi:(2,3-dihydroxybenzoyl)adenylate synthase [Mycolicibacter acidiphilus]
MSVVTGFVPFPADRAERYRAAGYWAGHSLDELLHRTAQTRPSHAAVIDAAETLSYAEFDARVDRAAGGYAALGVAPGDRMLLQLPNSCRFAVALFGLLRAGAVPVLCLPGHRSAELSHFAEVSGAVGIVADTGVEPLGLRHTVIDDEPLPPGEPPQVAVDPRSPALLLASGGTTGLPKLIPRTHDDYVYNATASARLCRLTGDDVYLVALPAAHNFPLACPGLLGAISVGATTVFTADPSPDAAFGVIDRHGITVTALVPTLARLWAQACDWEPVTPRTLRLLQVGGAKLAPEDARLVRTALTPGLQQVFGMAEGLLNFTRLDDAAEVLETTQGRPLCDADEVRVVDESGADVPPGAEGELLVRGPYTLNGYFNDDAVNQRSFTADGFFRSGDRVRLLDGGYLEVTGRVKDVIHRGGESVAAADLEDHLRTHPGVAAVAAVALPDPHLGEKICAAVVFRAEPVTIAELNRHLEQRGAATHTRCDALAPLPALPVTAFGKVDKKEIVRRILYGR